jgi:hypothetical protein
MLAPPTKLASETFHLTGTTLPKKAPQRLMSGTRRVWSIAIDTLPLLGLSLLLFACPGLDAVASVLTGRRRLVLELRDQPR